MNTPSGDLHVVDFKTNQIVSAVQPKDYWDDKRHWEIKNNIDTLEFRVFENTDHAATLVQQNLVLKEVRGGRIVPYVITETEKDFKDRSLMVYASGEWIQLAKAGIIEPQKIESKTLKQCMEIALKGTKWKIGKTEHDGAHSMVIEEFTDPLDLLKKIAASFELEIQYRTEVVGSKIVGRFVDMVQKRGRDTRKEITFGKDLIGIKRIENSQSICTALLGFVKKENGEFITISSINKGVPYLVDDAAYQRWNENGKHKFAFYTPQTDDQNMSSERLLTLMKTEMGKLVNASVSYGVDAQNIARIPGLSHEEINEGDTIRIIDEGFTPKLYIEARAIAGDESFKDPTKDNYVFGDYREIVDQNDELRRLYQKILSSLYDKVPQELFDQLKDKVKEQNKDIIDAKDKADQAQKESQTAKDLAETTQKYIEQNMVDIIEQPTAPTENLLDGKTLWIDSSDPENKVQKLWKGGQWQRVTPDTGPLKQSIKNAENDINNLKETVKDMPDTTWLNQQLEGKANKEDTYTKDWINGNLIGKQVYETNREGDIKVLTETKTTAERTAEEIKNKAEKTEITTLTDNLKLVSQTANTAKQTAESNTNTITELKTTVNSISVGSINLASSSETGLNKQNMTGNWSDSKQMTVSDKVNYRNKTFTISFLFTGKMTKLNTNPWFGVETAITYADGEQEWKSVRADSQLKINVDYKDEPLSVAFRTKDKDVTQVKFYYSGRNIDGNLNSHHAKFEEGNIRTTWQLSNDEVTSKADFTQTTNEIQQTVNTNSQTISKVQKDQGTMQSTLNQVKQTTDSNSQTITTLSQKQGKQGEIIQQNTSDITQLNNQMKSKVSDTQMQEYVGGLGSTNLIFNAAFEDRVINASTGAITNTTPSTTKWSVVGTGSGITIVSDSARHHEGYNSVKITATGQTSSKWSGIMQRVPAVQNGGDYVFSAWVYVQDKKTLDNGGAIKLQFFNGANAVSTFVQTEFKDLLVNNSWVLVSVKITSPNVAVTHLQGDIWVRQNGTIWVSQPQLQQGSTRSTFMENPKDYANYDQLVGEIAKKVATSDFNNKFTQMETTINQQSNRIDLKAEKTDVYTKTEANGQFGSKAMVEKHESSITLMSNEINSTVKKGDIISTINQTAEAVKISAGKIQLDGTTIAKYLEAQELKGTTIRTDNGSNYVHIQKQFIRLMESNLNRMFIGYYKRAVDSQIQPTILMHDDVDTSRFRDGTLTISQFPVKGENYYTGSFGIVKGYDADQTPHYCAKLNVDTNGDVSLNGDNYIYITGKNGVTLRSDKQLSAYTNTIRLDSVSHADILTGGALFMKSNQNTEVNSGGHTIITSGKGISQYAKNGSYWVEVANGATFTVSNPSNAFWVDSAGGITLKGGSKSVWMDSQSSIVFNLKGKNMLDIVATPNAETDLRFQTVMLRNGNVEGYKTLQVKDGTGNAFNAVTASAFQTASKREYKTNIRDVQFSAIEKIMALQIQQYNLKTDIEDLYEKRMNRVEGDPILTTNDIETHYGWIADDENTPECFVTKTRNAVEIYSSVAIQIKAFQEEKQAKDAEIQELKEENKQMNRRIEVLEQLLLQNLNDKKPEQP
ncbi:phage tail spike protein [Bacillus thuringiensis]|uniref:phage tail spike protein n=1 Tax=Bacillus thuringiensis TaxID=1428 RepID=UPI000BF73E2B|nr:phage tail spike protein [Bacillus thuringiensis]PES39217.1 peptidase S74 [Bacillus thuringiensis]